MRPRSAQCKRGLHESCERLQKTWCQCECHGASDFPASRPGREKGNDISEKNTPATDEAFEGIIEAEFDSKEQRELDAEARRAKALAFTREVDRLLDPNTWRKS